MQYVIAEQKNIPEMMFAQCTTILIYKYCERSYTKQNIYLRLIRSLYLYIMSEMDSWI